LFLSFNASIIGFIAAGSPISDKQSPAVLLTVTDLSFNALYNKGNTIGFSIIPKYTVANLLIDGFSSSSAFSNTGRSSSVGSI
jgi:hypothetical protein